LENQPTMDKFTVVAPDFKELCVKWLVSNFHSAREVENPAFRDMMYAANHKLKPMTSEGFWKLAKDKALELEVTLENMLKGQTVALTSDGWTSVQKLGYTATTAHWIQMPQWELDSNATVGTGFKCHVSHRLRRPHTGVYHQKNVKGRWMFWGKWGSATVARPGK
jgi:hypothetical protein